MSSIVPGAWSLPLSATLPSYADIETTVAPAVGPVEVYKVHHHGSRYSSNASWLSVTTPMIGIVSVGAGNSYGHPTADALNRLHAVGTRMYWTSIGGGVAPRPGSDVVSGTTIVEIGPGAAAFTVRYGSDVETYPLWGYPATPADSGLPIGLIDTPADMSSVAGEVAVTGWAIDNTGLAGIDIYRSPVSGEPTSPNGLVYIGTAVQIEGARPDVAAAFPLYPGVAMPVGA